MKFFIVLLLSASTIGHAETDLVKPYFAGPQLQLNSGLPSNDMLGVNFGYNFGDWGVMVGLYNLRF